jgi:thiol-disulfide isomerase/thioredoxin
MESINWKTIGIVVLIIVLVLCTLKIVGGYRSQPHSEIEMSEGFAPKDNYKAEIILYHTTWCGYSKQFKPIWDEFLGKVANNKPHVKFTDIVCEGGNETLCNQKGIEGYPTVILYMSDGTEARFDGGRTADELVKFLDKHNL